MAVKYIEEQLNRLDREMLVQMFLGIQNELLSVNDELHQPNDRMANI